MITYINLSTTTNTTITNPQHYYQSQTRPNLIPQHVAPVAPESPPLVTTQTLKGFNLQTIINGHQDSRIQSPDTEAALHQIKNSIRQKTSVEQLNRLLPINNHFRSKLFKLSRIRRQSSTSKGF
ncbi:hypothetical protein BY996DRAFT_6515117 [Phakopsora pachyrhizi]|nr:hypothetical protein BY996DRAFT_6515117 [Phakopsora pachyrhizi]